MNRYWVPYIAGGAMDIYPAYMQIWAESIGEAVEVAKDRSRFPQIKVLISKIVRLS